MVAAYHQAVPWLSEAELNQVSHQSVVWAVGVPLVPPVAVLGSRPISFAAYARMTLCMYQHSALSDQTRPTDEHGCQARGVPFGFAPSVANRARAVICWEAVTAEYVVVVTGMRIEGVGSLA